MQTMMVTLFVSLILLALFELNFSNSPYSRNVKMNQEWNAINEGREMVERELNSFQFRKHLLCATFVNSTHEASKKNLIKNMKSSYFDCDWAIVIYGGSKEVICNHHEYQKYFVFCNHTHALKKHPDLMAFKHIPKPLMFFDVLPYLPDYQYVVLFDEDISVQEFNFSAYNEIFHCSFYPSPPPLISQGLVREESQDFPFLRPSGWKDLPDVIASEAVFIEQQMPLINTVFLKWFVEHVMSRVVPKIVETGSTWVGFFLFFFSFCLINFNLISFTFISQRGLM
jgi:hypothetical protein